jgi:hypothetical protein
MLPLFTKLHYEKIAQIISRLPKEAQSAAIEEFSKTFEKDNLLFQKARFIESCKKAGVLVS